jgi:hypothetical protein
MPRLQVSDEPGRMNEEGDLEGRAAAQCAAFLNTEHKASILDRGWNALAYVDRGKGRR